MLQVNCSCCTDCIQCDHGYLMSNCIFNGSVILERFRNEPEAFRTTHQTQEINLNRFSQSRVYSTHH